MWEEVITCYQHVGRHAQAERIVRERMKVEGESVKLLCLLGDVTQVGPSECLYVCIQSNECLFVCLIMIIIHKASLFIHSLLIII